MKKGSFLSKLHEEKKLQLVAPSEEVKQSYLAKSRSYLKSAKILLENEQIEEAVPMAYYSMYYAATALLYKAGIKCENHSACILLLKQLFNLDNSKIKFAKKERIDKQYYVDFHVAAEDVEELIEMAEEFNASVYDFIEKLTAKQVAEYRQNLEKMLT